jgi:large subunit ribosomal protein L10
MRGRVKGPRSDKVEVVGDLGAIFRQSQALILTNYRGLTVSQITNLRKKLRAVGGEYHVVKNTLFKRVMGDRVTPELEKVLAGPTAIVFAQEDPVAATKALLDFLRELRRDDINVKGGYIDGKVLKPDQVTALSKLPSREVILGQALGTIQGPLNEFAGTLNNVLGEFARTLQALADKQQAA